MTLKTIPVRVTATMSDGSPAVGCAVTSQLVDGRGVAAAFGVDDGVVVPWLITGTTDGAGQAVLAHWPNERGTESTLYRVMVKSGELVLLNATIAVPDSDPAVELAIGDLINQPPWPAVSASQQALTQLQAAQVAMTQAMVEAEDARDDAQAVLQDAGFILVRDDLGNINTVATAILSVVAVAGSLANINAAPGYATSAAASASAAAGSASGAAASASASAGSATASAGSATTAQGAASAAAASAASAASVAQQDLSGVAAQRLHGGPNSIVGMLVDDGSRDSDPSWPDRCSHLSYVAGRTLNGTWLGWVANEAAARAVSGATTNDYFGNTTDGLFYKLNAGSGVTATTDGNTAKFPRRRAFVWEAGRVVIYDLTNLSTTRGAPMWMVFSTGSTGATILSVVSLAFTVSSLAYRDGVLAVAGAYGTQLINFAADWMKSANVNQIVPIKQRIVDRNATGGQRTSAAEVIAIASNTSNAVAMTTMPDAPVDPFTGLAVPTIAIATAGGISIIQNDGTVRNSSSASSFSMITLTRDALYAMPGGGNLFVALKPNALGAAFALTTLTAGSAGMFPNPTVAGSLLNPTRSLLARRSASFPRFSIMRVNEPSMGASLIADVGDTYNAGCWCGDLRRAWGGDVSTEALPGPNIVVGGDFTSGTGWSTSAGISVGGGTYNASAYTGFGFRQATLTDGKVIEQGAIYQVSFDITAYTAGTCRPYMNASATFGGGPYSGVGSYSTTIISGSNSGEIGWSFAGFTGSVDNLVITKIGVADHGYKNKPITAYGAGLIRTAVATAAQLTAISGFSATSYLQEAYSSDLDFGTAGFSVSAWVSYTTAAASSIAERNAASGASITLGTDASGKLTATVYDGTTTRTVTTAAAYNTGAWTKVRASLSTSGTLSISVAGREVATTTGTPLLTLTNASAVCTVGNDRTLATAFVGSIAMLKWSATIPTPDQAAWMYEQEKEMFYAGAQVTLPDSGALADIAYDEKLDRLITVSAANEAAFTGLVRTSSAAVSAGSFTKAAAGGGAKLLARSTSSPGVDITIPAQNLKEELLRREEAAARRARAQVYDFSGGFTGNTTNGSTAIASVAGFTYPKEVNPRGMPVSGTGIPAGAVITEVVGTTVYISAPATATNTGVQIAATKFPAPPGHDVARVFTAGTRQREGSGNAYTKEFDGFVERAAYVAAPGYTAWVQLECERRVVA